MRGAVLSFSLALTFASLAGPALAEKPPVVVELFTAQGCASCPQANKLLGDFADRKGVIALTFPVNYWDYMGWPDTFAHEEFSDRQRAYVARLRLREIYIPEVVVGGQREAPGLERDKINGLIAQVSGERSRGPKLRFLGHGAHILVERGQAPRGGAEVWLVRYDPRARDVRVRAGENRGKTVTQRNVVHELVKLGSWTGRPKSFVIPAPQDDSLKTVVLVQDPRGGRILAAAQLGA